MFARTKRAVAQYERIQRWSQATGKPGMNTLAREAPALFELPEKRPLLEILTPEQLATLGDPERPLLGKVVTPYDPDYEKARQLFNQAFQKYPQLIVYCECADDVRRCLEFAHKHPLRVTCRSGGHSTAGYSANDGGMIIDVSQIRYCVVDEGKRRARVGAGTPLDMLNAVLDGYGLHVPGGGCGDVAVSGHMMGGGYGFTSREYGMNCDALRGATVMLADGRIVHASAEEHTELFWALRGGTGNNFGVLLELEYELYDLREVWGFGIQWSIEQAAEALQQLQEHYTKEGASDRLGYLAVVMSQPGKNNRPPKQVLVMRGMYHGKEAEGRKELAPLLKTGHLAISKRGTYRYLNDSLVADIPELPPNSPYMANQMAGYVDRKLGRDEWASAIEYFKTSPVFRVKNGSEEQNVSLTFILIEPYGGAINRVPPHDTAFVHRDVYMDFSWISMWLEESQRAEAQQWLTGFVQPATPLLNGQSYQNYPYPETPDYAQRYWSSNLDKLEKIRRHYDPEAFFQFPQSVPMP